MRLVWVRLIISYLLLYLPRQSWRLSALNGVEAVAGAAGAIAATATETVKDRVEAN